MYAGDCDNLCEHNQTIHLGPPTLQRRNFSNSTNSIADSYKINKYNKGYYRVLWIRRVLIPSLRITNPLPGISPRALLLILYYLHCILYRVCATFPFSFGNNKVQVVTFKTKNHFWAELIPISSGLLIFTATEMATSLGTLLFPKGGSILIVVFVCFHAYLLFAGYIYGSVTCTIIMDKS